MYDMPTMRHVLGTVIKLADAGLINRDDYRHKADCIADAVIAWLGDNGIYLDWDNANGTPQSQAPKPTKPDPAP